MKRIRAITLCLLMFGCTGREEQHSEGSEAATSGPEIVFADHIASVLIFVSPNCPLSQNYSRTINQLDSMFSAQQVVFQLVFPGQITQAAIDSFTTQYRLHQQVIPDSMYLLAKKLQATTTPETFIFNTHGKLVYQGAIDNWAVDLGQKRQVITAFYVRDVLQAMIDDAPIPYTKTTAVGCFIETGIHQHDEF